MATAESPNPNRNRLQQAFAHASKAIQQGQFEYGANTLTQCVLGDPGNRIYATQFLSCLGRLYNNNKKGSKMAALSGMGARTMVKKASMQKDWMGVIKSGVEVLKLNPWNVSTLLAMARACDGLEHSDAQLAYYKSALEVNPKDVEVNRQCARALAIVGQFDQALACWTRVLQLKPGDIEAQKAMGDLAVERTIANAGYEDAQSTRDVKAAKDEEHVPGEKVVTPEQKLEKLIAKNPADVANYVELADMHIRNDRLQEAEQLFATALQVSGGGDVTIRERYEDTQLRRGRQQLAIAEKRATDEGTEQAVDLVKQMKKDLNRLELEVYRSRSERYPTNLNYKFEVGLRLKQAGQYSDAIQLLQQARGDSKRKAQVHVELGDCFKQIKQLKLALTNYEEAINSMAEHSTDLGKYALYWAGLVAYHLKNLELAEKHLSELAGIDFGYRDVAKWLDKLARDGQND